MFSPGSSTQERDRKVDVGMTALLTMSIVLLMLIDMMPKTQISSLPWMGGTEGVGTGSDANGPYYRQIIYAIDSAHLLGNGDECANNASSLSCSLVL